MACRWRSVQYGATFDLSGLELPAGISYEVQDGDNPCTPEVEQTYNYLYNICGEVSGARNPDVWQYCYENLQKPSENPSNLKAAAMQYDVIGSADDCKVVGYHREDSKNYEWSLIDSQDPAKGVSITYEGPMCHHVDVARKFTIYVPCQDNNLAMPLSALEPDQACHYEVEMPSFHGCPLECPINGGHLCSANGICRFDKVIHSPRCFCNEGYTGNSCSDKGDANGVTSSSSGTETGLTVVLLIISAALVGVVVFMIRKVHGYRQDASNYIKLNGGDTDMDM